MAHLIQNLLFTVYIGAMQQVVFKFVLLATPCLSFPLNQSTPKEARLARPVQPKQLLSVSFAKRLLQILPLNRDVFYLEYVHVIVLCRFMCPCKRKVDLYGTLRPCPVTVTQCLLSSLLSPPLCFHQFEELSKLSLSTIYYTFILVQVFLYSRHLGDEFQRHIKPLVSDVSK